VKDSSFLPVDQSAKLTDRDLSSKSQFTMKWKVSFWPTNQVLFLTLIRNRKCNDTSAV